MTGECCIEGLEDAYNRGYQQGLLDAKCGCECSCNPTPEEVISSITAGGDVNLPISLNITSKIALAKPTNLNLNGHTIRNETPGGDAIQLGGGAFSFKNGAIDNTVGGGATAGIYANSSKGNNIVLEDMDITATYPVYLNNATGQPECVIKSGKFVSPFDKGVAVYVEKGGHAVIEGGYFSTEGHDSSFLLNLKDSLRDKPANEYITVKGGKFVNFNPADCNTEGSNTNFVADGYRVIHYPVGEDIIYEVIKE